MSYICEKAVGKDRTCDFRSGKVILQQAVDRAQMSKLLATGKTDLLPRFISKKNRPFQAFLVVNKEKKVSFEFQPREPKKGGAARKEKPKEEKVDFTGMEPVGKCPKCGGKVFETPNDFRCENTQAEKKPCKFKAGKTILSQPIDRAQVTKLLEDGRTDLMTQFVSSKTGRPFSAYLTVDDTGKVAFEFPPRETEKAA